MPITREALRGQLRARWEDTPFWTDDEAHAAILSALRTWNALTGYFRVRRVVPTIPHDPLVPLDGTILQRTAIDWAGAPLVRVSLTELGQLQPNWWYERAGDARLPSRPTLWAACGLSLIAVWPAAPVPGTLGVDGIRQTPTFVDDASTVDIDADDLGVILGYALHVASLKAGATFLQRTQPQYAAFIEAAATVNAAFRASDWFRRRQRREFGPALQPVGVGAQVDGQPVEAEG